MRRFDENATLDKLAPDTLTRDLMRELAHAIRAMHAQAEPRAAEPAIAAMGTWIEQNAESFAARPDLFPAQAAAELARLSREALAHAAPQLRERGARGWIRRCHGDLHLGNIALIDGRPTPFDAIEFDDAIATGDVLYDLAFAVMDLWERDLRPQANQLLNAYLAPGEAEPYDALAPMPLFLSLRAAIRAKVEANAAGHMHGAAAARETKSARRYFDFALRFLKPEPPRLVAVGGLSGVGKSAVAAALSVDLGRPPGAIWLRSDVERKAMFGVAEETHLPAQAYSAAASHETYARLIDRARRALKAGAAVVIDAAHAHAAEREAAAALATETGVPFAGLWLEAPLDVRLRRIGGRTGDASDADEAVARRQRAEPLGEPGWRALDASGGLEKTLQAARVASAAGAGI
jgi:predicted kinase